MDSTTYTTYGSVRGRCGHRHTTLAGAEKCLNRDRSGCDSQGGYSDREIVLVGQDGYLYHDLGQMVAEDGDHWIRSEGGCGVKL